MSTQSKLLHLSGPFHKYSKTIGWGYGFKKEILVGGSVAAKVVALRHEEYFDCLATNKLENMKLRNEDLILIVSKKVAWIVTASSSERALCPYVSFALDFRSWARCGSSNRCDFSSGCRFHLSLLHTGYLQILPIITWR